MTRIVPTRYPGDLSRAQVVAWRNGLFVVFLLAGLAFASWAARLPAVRDALQIGVDRVGVLVFGIAAGSIVGLLLSSHVIARLGARRTIAWGMVGTGAGIVVAGAGVSLAASFGVVFAGLAIFGFAAGTADVAMNVSAAAGERVLGRSVMSIFHAFFSFGTMLGAGLGALAEFAAVPLVVHLGVTAVVVVCGSLLAVPRLQSEDLAAGDEPVATDDRSRTWRGRLSIWRDPRTLLIGVVVLAAAFAEGSANDWIAIAMVDGHGVDKPAAALVLGVFLTAMTVGRLGGVLLLDRFGRVVVLRASFALAAAGLLAIIVVPNAIVATIGAGAWGLGSALGFPIGMSAAADDPHTAAARVSAVATIGYAAFLVGPPAIGLLGEHVGILGALLVVLVLCAVGAASAGAMRAPGRRAIGAPGDPSA